MASVENFQDEEKLKLVRERLKQENVKLWLSPYTVPNGDKGEEPKELIENYSRGLNLSEEEVRSILEQLRCNAVQKLACKKRFQETALATLKIKLSGQLKEVQQKTLSIDVSLQMTGQELKAKVSQMTNVSADRLKLICAGRVIDDYVALQDQSVKNLSMLMGLCLSESEAEARKHQEDVQRVAKTREAAAFLSAKEDGGEDDNQNYYLQVADQSGNIINMPSEERKALVMAMTLHEKGRAAIKRKEYGEALLLLLEADKEFSVCRSSILDAVDNYAILCLEIVWCHLCLQNISDLPDAEKRLQKCDECFRKSYGPNLERLQLLRGGTGMEKALFMRLHLLQGILAYHKHKLSEAQHLLTRAENELKMLQVDDDAMSQVVAMGFTEQEARLGLRVSEGNVQLAISHIMTRREEKEARKAKEREEKRRKVIQRKLGKTASGIDVNVDAYESLQGMGFSRGGAAEALRQSNNDITMAVQVLQEQPELLELSDPEFEATEVTEDMISQVASMGFDRETARIALGKFSGQVEKVIEELLKVAGEIPVDWITDVATNSSSSASSSSDTSPSKASSSTSDEDKARKRQEKEAIDAIVPDIPDDEEDHLDLCLDEEAAYLQQYTALLQSLR